MASLLNNASLLLNPAGSIISYQEDKIYSVLPKDGTGDFTFSGGDGGTRVNQQGYIEQTPANFMLNSVTTWNPSNVTVTTGVTDPVGGTGAYTIGSIASGNITDYAYKLSNAISLPAGTTFTYSIYMKGSGTIATYVERSVSGGYFFDVKTHTLSSEWQVFTHSYTVSSDANGVGVYVGNATGTTATSVDIAFPMLNYGSTAKPYQPTTDRLNYPRITYQNGRGALLSEPQRTNVNTYSQAIIAANGYNLGGCSLTGNNAISPDGTQNATLFVESANSNYHRYYKYGTGTASTKVWTIFAKYKPGGREWLTMDAGPQVYFNIANGTLGNTSSDIITQIEPYKDGWYRCTYIDPTSAVDLCFVGAATYNGDPGNYAGDGRDCFWVWGMQCEDGVSFPTSYIPTTSATVTRPLDQSSVTNLESSGLTGTNVGTLYLSVANTGIPYQAGTINAKVGGGGNFPYNYMILDGITSSNRIRIFNSSAQTATYTFTETFAKIAVTADGTNSTVFVNGIKKGISAGLLAGIEEITQEATGAGLRYANATYTTALSDAQCQELTTVRSGSGGNISYYGPYTIHTFTGSATFTPSFTGPVEVLVVAGGGSGAAGWGNGGGMGGGGAGGLLYVSSYGVSAGTGVTVTIGAGGAGTTGTTQSGRNGTQRGNPGSNTSFGGLTTIGGGGGASDGATTATMTGGSGGGGGYASIGTGGAGTPGQGNNGGDHSNTNGYPSNYCGGGGGGAGVVGTPGTTAGGNGGNGLPYSISGFSTYYAGGGGGGTYTTTGPGGAGVGGLGGGGNGGLGTTNPGQNGIAGVNFTGGAGGAGGCPASSPNIGGNGGAGGSGIVIVRYLT